MKLTVLGSSASYPGAGRACAGHLVTSGDTSVLLDCGSGVLSNLARLMDPTRLDAVFVTHAHVDHFADLYALQAGLRYGPNGPSAPVPLYLPPGLFERMGALLSSRGAADLAQAFDVRDLAEGLTVRVGDLTIVPRGVEHVDPTFALVVEGDTGRLCYTSDTRFGEPVLMAAAGANVLLADATLPAAFEGRVPHMTAGQAGTVASRSGAHTLVLTHLWPSMDRNLAEAEARQHFGGRVIVADELSAVDVVGEEAASETL